MIAFEKIEEYMMLIFGLMEKSKKPRKTTTVSVKLKDIEKFAVGEQITASSIIEVYKFKNDIKNRFEEQGDRKRIVYALAEEV